MVPFDFDPEFLAMNNGLGVQLYSYFEFIKIFMFFASIRRKTYTNPGSQRRSGQSRCAQWEIETLFEKFKMGTFKVSSSEFGSYPVFSENEYSERRRFYFHVFPPACCPVCISWHFCSRSRVQHSSKVKCKCRKPLGQVSSAASF